MPSAYRTEAQLLRDARRDVLAALNGLRDNSKCSRARIYVWLQAVLSNPDASVGEMTLDQCKLVLEEARKEEESGFKMILSGVKPLHHRNSLSGTLHPAKLRVSNGEYMVSVFLSEHTWEAPVKVYSGKTIPSTSDCQVEFRGPMSALVLFGDTTVGEVPQGQFWVHG